MLVSALPIIYKPIKIGVVKAVSSLFAILSFFLLCQIFSNDSFLSTGTTKGTNMANLRKFHRRNAINFTRKIRIFFVAKRYVIK